MYSDQEIIERSKRSSESFWEEISQEPEYFFLNERHPSSKHFVASILQGGTVKGRCSVFFEAPAELTNNWSESKFKTKEKAYRDLVLRHCLMPDTDFVKLIDAVVAREISAENLADSFESLCFEESAESRNLLLTTIGDIESLADSATAPTEISVILRQGQFTTITNQIRAQELNSYHAKIKKEALAIQQMSLQDKKKMEERTERQAREAAFKKMYPKKESDPWWARALYILIPSLLLTYCAIKNDDVEVYNHPACEALGLESNLKGTECR